MKYSVLIVDDSTVTRSAIRRSIEISGFPLGKCFEAPNGVDAIQILNNEDVDFAFTDLNMPKMDGLGLLRHMGEHKLMERTKVFVVSTQRSVERIAEVMKLGASGYLPKPFTPEKIHATLEREINA